MPADLVIELDKAAGFRINNDYPISTLTAKGLVEQFRLFQIVQDRSIPGDVRADPAQGDRPPPLSCTAWIPNCADCA